MFHRNSFRKSSRLSVIVKIWRIFSLKRKAKRTTKFFNFLLFELQQKTHAFQVLLNRKLKYKESIAINDEL